MGVGGWVGVGGWAFCPGAKTRGELAASRLSASKSSVKSGSHKIGGICIEIGQPCLRFSSRSESNLAKAVALPAEEGRQRRRGAQAALAAGRGGEAQAGEDRLDLV